MTRNHSPEYQVRQALTKSCLPWTQDICSLNSCFLVLPFHKCCSPSTRIIWWLNIHESRCSSFISHIPPLFEAHEVPLKHLLQNALAVHQIPPPPNTFCFQKLYLSWTLAPIKSTFLSAICQWVFSKDRKQGHWQTHAKTQCTSVWAFRKNIPGYTTRAAVLYGSSASFTSASYQSWHLLLALCLFPQVSLDKGDITCPFASFNTRVKMLSSPSKRKPWGVM